MNGPRSFSRGLAGGRTGRWARAVLVLPSGEVGPLLATVARRYDADQPTVLAAAFLLVLSRYHASDSVSVRVAVAGESRPVHLPVAPAHTVGDVVARVRDALSAEPSGGVSADATLPCCVVVRRAGSAPAPPRDAVLAVELVTGLPATRVRLRWRDRAFTPAVARRFRRHLGRILREWMHEPTALACALPLLDASETARVLSCSQGPVRDYPFQPLAETFARQAAAAPDRVVVVGERSDGSPERLTYAVVRGRAAATARLLREQGAAGERVGVCMDRRPALVPVVLGVLGAGAVYVPLDPSYPPEYLRFILEDAGIRVLVADDALDPRAIPPQVTVVSPPELEEPWDGGDTASLPPDQPCLVMYTSGSTGRPKGVVHCQRQLVNRLHWMWETYPFRDGDVIAQRSPVTVMPSMWELLGGLLAGIPTAVVPAAVLRDPAELAAFLARHAVSYATFTPTVLRMLLDACGGGSVPGALRVVVVGGEPVDGGLCSRFAAAFPSAVLVDDFGATEVNTILHRTAVVGTAGPCSGAGYRPISNVAALVLDDAGRPVPFGVEGELCVAGPSLALGYVNRPDEEALRFVTWCPDGGEPVRVYRTGDMVWMEPREGIRVSGRRDHQVKVNGLRVELGEVERVLGLHPDVKECALVWHAGAGNGLLWGWVALRAAGRGTAVDAAGLRAWLKHRLPRHMVPRRVEIVDALPRRPNGKLDRPSLAARAPAAGPSSIAGSRAVATVRAAVGRVLGVPAEEVDVRAEFDALGVDSVSAVRLAAELSGSLGRPLSPVRLFDHPTPARLAEHLSASGILPPAHEDGGSRDARAGREQGVRGPLETRLAGAFPLIAIVGISGRFPGADDVSAFWENLRAGVESIATAAPGRWDAGEIYDPDPAVERRSYSRWCGFLRGADEFDPDFFGIAPAEARVMDPQQRLCMMEAWHALEDAGLAGERADGLEVAVFVGARPSDYPVLLARTGRAPAADTLLGNDHALIAARVSHAFDLRGPSLVVDTACSSSLVALHLACRSLAERECDVALVGGVCVTADPDFLVATSKLGILSPRGHCSAFDADADGFVHGEGVAFVALRRLEDAQAAGDRVYAVVRGTAVNQDGRSNGITAPNGQAQSALYASLYRRLGIDAADIGYVEAHGTGTRLGDPVEVEALARAFARSTSRKGFCGLGSVKTNVGHLTAAAGITGLIKAALCLRTGEWVPSLHFARANPLIDFASTPFFVVTERRPWPAPARGPRRAAVSALGIGGTNAHCVLEEAPTASRLTPAGRARLFPVTAPLAGAVPRVAGALRDWLAGQGADACLADLSWTLLAGRRLFPHGWIIAARDASELRARLLDVEAGRVPPSAVLLSGRDEEVDRAASDSALAALAAAQNDEARLQALLTIAHAVAGGCRPGWRRLFPGECPVLLSVVGYPFARTRFWIDAPSAVASSPDAAAPAQAESVAETIRRAVGELLGVEPATLSFHEPLPRYGLDSVRALALKHRLDRTFGRAVPLDCLYDGSTIHEVADQLGAAADTPECEGWADRFLAGSLDLHGLADEELERLYGVMLQRVEAAHA